MSNIFNTRQEEIIFTQLEIEPIFSEDLRETREIMKQCWDIVGVDQYFIYGCFAIYFKLDFSSSFISPNVLEILRSNISSGH